MSSRITKGRQAHIKAALWADTPQDLGKALDALEGATGVLWAVLSTPLGLTPSGGPLKVGDPVVASAGSVPVFLGEVTKVTTTTLTAGGLSFRWSARRGHWTKGDRIARPGGPEDATP